MDLPNLKIHKSENNYFYFTPKSVAQQHCIQATPPKVERRRSAVGRSSTPNPLIKPVFKKAHRRSVSLSSAASYASSPASNIPSLHLQSSYDSLKSPLEEVTDSLYDASISDSNTSIMTSPSTPTGLLGVKVWLVLRVVPRQVEVYLHSR